MDIYGRTVAGNFTRIIRHDIKCGKCDISIIKNV